MARRPLIEQAIELDRELSRTFDSVLDSKKDKDHLTASPNHLLSLSQEELDELKKFRDMAANIKAFDPHGIHMLKVIYFEVFGPGDPPIHGTVDSQGTGIRSIGIDQRNIAVIRRLHSVLAIHHLDQLAFQISAYEEKVLRATWEFGTLTARVNWLTEVDAMVESAQKAFDLDEPVTSRMQASQNNLQLKRAREDERSASPTPTPSPSTTL